MAEIKKDVRQKSCSKCGDSFSCGAGGAEEHCWCEALPHLPLSAIGGSDCLCPSCLNDSIQTALQPAPHEPALDSAMTLPAATLQPQIKPDARMPGLLVEGEDFYSDGGMIVFTASYHLRRGYCCENGCRHCPFDNRQAGVD